MSIDALLGWLLESTLAVSAALLLVLALRLPLRRLFGAGAAYACWALVPLALLAVSLPAPVREAVTYAMPLQAGAVQTAPAMTAPMPTMPSWWQLHGPWLLAAVWAMGALLVAIVFWHQQRQFVASLGRTRRDAAGLLRADAVAGCPAVVGAWSPRIVLPADFEARYPAHEGELVLAHERVHLARQDVRLNLLAVALRCLHWFNPLLHYAARSYRQDQELACDAAVLARHPRSRRAYADAMLKTQLAVLGLPVGCHWQSSQSLKERILMLKQPLPKRGRTRLGLIAVVGLLLGASYAAWALQPERIDQVPAHLGTKYEGDVLYADIQTRSGAQTVVVVNGGMGNGPGGASRAFSGKDGTLKIGFGGSSGPDALLLTANMTGAGDAQELQWRLERGGERVDGGSAKLPAGQSVSLDIDGAKYQVNTSATVKIMHATDGVLMGEFDQPRQLKRGADGIYIDEHGGGIWGPQYQVPGEAQVLVQISDRGEVMATTVESSNPPGAFTEEAARSFFSNAKYSPQMENGVAVPARIRTKVTFSPPQPETGKTVDVRADTEPGITVRDAAQRIAAAAGLAVANPEVLPVDRKVRFAFNALPAEVAFELLAQEVGMKAMIDEGQVRFVPTGAGASQGSSTTSAAEPQAVKIDLRMKLMVDGQAEAMPRIVTHNGEEFQVQFGRDEATTTIDGVATLLRDGKIEIATTIRRGDKQLASPTIHVADGEPGSIEIDEGRFKLEFDASAKPERYRGIQFPPRVG